ncbi:MAG: alpha/beta hydrolase-fold protein [Gammaproteobacteria bacterium]
MPRKLQDVRTNLTKLCSALHGTPFEAFETKVRAQQSCPLVEDIQGDTEHKRVTFFYYDEKGDAETVKVCGRYPSFKQAFQRVGNICIITADLPKDFCTTYYFEVKRKGAEKPEIIEHDPLNPRCFYESARNFNPVLDLLKPFNQQQEQRAIAEQEAAMENIKKQDRLKTYYINSHGVIADITDPAYTKDGTERIFHVHLPEGYDPTKAYPMRLFLDGKWYLDAAEVPTILEDGKTINIMLEPKAIEGNANIDRDYEYRPDRNIKGFTEFLSKTFIPSVQEKFHVSTAPADVTICGSSLSGFAAMHIGLHHPEIFGNVLTQSAALWLSESRFTKKGEDFTLLPPGEKFLFPELRSGELNINQLRQSRFYMETLSHDFPSNCIANRDFVDAMRDLKIPCRTAEKPGEHHFAVWEKSLPEATRILQERSLRAEAETSAPTPTLK